MTPTKINSIIILFLCSLSPLIAQQYLQLSNMSFNQNPEILEAQISEETILLRVLEIDSRKYDNIPNLSDCTNCPHGNVLILEVDLQEKFTFPIGPNDPISLSWTYAQEGMAEYEHNIKQAEYFASRINAEKEQEIKQKNASITAQTQKISQQLKEGKISPQEAEKKIYALLKSQEEQVFSLPQMDFPEGEEIEEKANFTLHLVNEDEQTTSEITTGTLRIISFDSERIKLHLEGKLTTECTDNKQVSDESGKCSQVLSTFYPNRYVLKEENISLSLDLRLKEFLNNRY